MIPTASTTAPVLATSRRLSYVVGGRDCAGRGCLFWIVASVVLSMTLTILANLVLLLFSGGG
jgi:hypothetical protein